MLYKKIHRQFFRQFKKGRKFKWDDREEVCEVVRRGPWVGRVSILVDTWQLIRMTGRTRGIIHYRHRMITWLD